MPRPEKSLVDQDRVTSDGRAGLRRRPAHVRHSRRRFARARCRHGGRALAEVIGSEILAAPAIGSGVVVVRTVDGRLRGYSAENGSTAWNIEQNLPTLTLRGNTAPRVAGPLRRQRLQQWTRRGLRGRERRPVWEVAIANPTGRSELERLVDVSAGLSIIGSDVYVAGYHGRAVGIDLETGVVLWQQEMSSYAGSVPTRQRLRDDRFRCRRRTRAMSGTQQWRQEALRLRDVTAPTRFANTHRRRRLRRLLHWLSPDGRHSSRASTPRASEFAARRSRRPERLRARRRRHPRRVHRAPRGLQT